MFGSILYGVHTSMESSKLIYVEEEYRDRVIVLRNWHLHTGEDDTTKKWIRLYYFSDESFVIFSELNIKWWN